MLINPGKVLLMVPKILLKTSSAYCAILRTNHIYPISKTWITSTMAIAYHVVVWLEGQGTTRTDVLTFPFQLANHREHGIAILSQLQEIEDEAVGSVRHLRLTVGIRLYNQDMVVSMITVMKLLSVAGESQKVFI